MDTTEEKGLMQVSRVVSAVFTPFSIPFLAYLVLFFLTYLRMMPLTYKVIVLAVVYCFTIFLPTLTIFLFRKLNGFNRRDLLERKRRYVPFWAALVIMVICVVLNLKWKLSEHMAGAGAVIGGVVVFSSLFNYNPVWWLCFFILISGLLGSARIILRHHTPGEVLSGFAVGLVCSVLVLDPFYSVMIRMFINSITH